MQIFSVINKGFKGEIVEIQCTIHPGFPSFDIVGSLSCDTKGLKEKIREAMRSLSLQFPRECIVVNIISKSDIYEASTLESAIFTSILFCKSKTNLKALIFGKIDIYGNIIYTPGYKNAIDIAKENSINFVSTPKNYSNMNSVVSTLIETINEYKDDEKISYDDSNKKIDENNPFYTNPFKGIIGLEAEKEALSVAAAGGHNMLLFGSKGVGKSLLVSRMKYLLPTPNTKGLNELNSIRAGFGYKESDKSELVTIQSHSKGIFSKTGNKNPEILLSHTGAVIIDEINTVDLQSILTLQSIIDNRQFNLNENESFPLSFTLIGTMNPCPCGAKGSRRSVCSCTSGRISSHWKNINSSFLSRFDIVMSQEEADFLKDTDSSFDNIKARIDNARERQYKRYEKYNDININADIVHSKNNSDFLKKAFIYFPEAEDPRDALMLYSLSLTFSDLDDNDDIEMLYIEKSKLLRIKNPISYYS